MRNMFKTLMLLTVLAVAPHAFAQDKQEDREKPKNDMPAALERGSEPAWSPDGKSLLITSGKYPDTEIYLIGADGTGLRRLTDNAHPDHYPVFSPDGRRFAYSSRREGIWRIILRDLEGGREQVLAETSRSEHNPARLSFSPDGRRLAFSSDRDGNPEIYAMTLETGEVTRLTDNPARDNAPAYSPDGRSIAFESNRDGDMEIYVMNADGSGPRRVTDSAGPDILPVWFPDGRKIGFLTGRHIVRGGQGGHSGGVMNWEIYKTLPDGSRTVRLTDNAYWDFYPVFSPDGSRVAFVSIREGHSAGGVYVMRLNGTEVVRLTKGAD